MTTVLPTSSSAPVQTAGQVPTGPGAAAALIEVALAAASGEALAPVSLTLDYGAPLQAGEAVTLEALVERTTRTLVFAHGRVLKADGALAASGSAVFRRLGVSSPDWGDWRDSEAPVRLRRLKSRAIRRAA